ncbi:MAG: drug/metabolite exporter YedA [Armatimonadetes bacterium]|nr:drug/metabolite exporter YedA [Armatimonadota bacterium]
MPLHEAMPSEPRITEEPNCLLAPAEEPGPSGSRAGIALALLTIYLVWGSTYLAMRIALGGLPPFLMAGVRFVIAGVLLLMVLRLRGDPMPTPRQWGGAALVGLLLLGGGNGGVVFAEQWVTSGMAALGVATAPLWAALLAGLWGEWPVRREWLGLALGIAGVVLLNLDGGLRASPLGAAALLLSSVCWALGTVWSRRLPLPAGMMASAAQMLCGGVILLLMSLLHGEHPHGLPTGRPLGALVYLIFGALAGFSAYVYLLPRVRPALATSNSYVNPLVAVWLGALLLGERVTPPAVLALLLILGGVALTVLAKPSQRGK